MKKIYVVLFALGLVACEKEEETAPLEYPSTYTSSYLESTSKIRVFTRQGEVTDPQVISSFVRRYGESFLFENGHRKDETPERADSLRIISATSAQSKRGSFRKWSDFSLVKKGQDLELIGKDTVYYVGAEWNISRDEYLFRLSSAFYKHPYAYHQQLIPLNSGFTYRYVERKVARINGQQLHFPMLNYALALYANYNGQYRPIGYTKISGVNNVLKEQPDLNQLKAGDSIAYQSFDLVFEKK
ncbi:hypothetical protein [Rufibacter tibetensis]|uniref:Uncharacterized protein n=1 Tax=Rufibacter tibetensis TaxID=512763 RepID=A0A0P0C6U7_9BACT|nr:hypothetical protein [Rufibacter tibetensis]ALI99079.1 hypothetical protein DC20_08955 [Rufibacter tibetensis]